VSGHPAHCYRRSDMVCNSKGITQFYLPPTHEPYLPLLPAGGHHRPLAGTHCTYPRRYGQAEFTRVPGYIVREIFPHQELNPGPIPVLTGKTKVVRPRLVSYNMLHYSWL